MTVHKKCVNFLKPEDVCKGHPVSGGGESGEDVSVGGKSCEDVSVGVRVVKWRE